MPRIPALDTSSSTATHLAEAPTNRRIPGFAELEASLPSQSHIRARRSDVPPLVRGAPYTAPVRMHDARRAATSEDPVSQELRRYKQQLTRITAQTQAQLDQLRQMQARTRLTHSQPAHPQPTYPQPTYPQMNPSQLAALPRHPILPSFTQLQASLHNNAPTQPPSQRQGVQRPLPQRLPYQRPSQPGIQQVFHAGRLPPVSACDTGQTNTVIHIPPHHRIVQLIVAPDIHPSTRQPAFQRLIVRTGDPVATSATHAAPVPPQTAHPAQPPSSYQQAAQQLRQFGFTTAELIAISTRYGTPQNLVQTARLVGSLHRAGFPRASLIQWATRPQGTKRLMQLRYNSAFLHRSGFSIPQIEKLMLVEDQYSLKRLSVLRKAIINGLMETKTSAEIVQIACDTTGFANLQHHLRANRYPPT